MKNLRVEIKIIAIVHVGEDVNHEGPAPDRDPDAVTSVVLARVAHVGPMVSARDGAAGHLAGIMANSAPVLGERLRHQLREKGL